MNSSLDMKMGFASFMLFDELTDCLLSLCNSQLTSIVIPITPCGKSDAINLSQRTYFQHTRVLLPGSAQNISYTPTCFGYVL